MKIKYQDCKFRPDSLAIIKQANVIIAAYAAQGFTLTLRQLYYQFVARGYLANVQKNYNRLSGIISDGRLAGLIDWDAIEDRTRNVRDLSHWTDPAEIVDAVAKQFHIDMWAGQERRVEVWIEKDALIGVIENACIEFDTPYFSCRGYVSQSEMWAGAMRFVQRMKRYGQPTTVLHFGDHDPSGLHMTHDISDRIRMFCAHHAFPNAFEMRRLALNMDQVEQYNPPPNPAKGSDPRFAGYQAEHGDESWELDALEPVVIAALIRDEIKGLIDTDLWEEKEQEKQDGRDKLQAVSDKWDTIAEQIDNL
jgi:hypothetical protein